MTITTATHTITAQYEVTNAAGITTYYDLDIEATNLADIEQEVLDFFNDEKAHGSNRDFETTDRDMDDECGTITIEGTVTAEFWGNDNDEETRDDDKVTITIEWDEN